MEAEAALLEHAAKSGGSFDYARFDCSACHHHLTFPSARQKRGFDGPPGRAPLKYWVGALPEVIAAHTAGGDLKAWGAGYADGWPVLRKAAVAKQLGDPQRVLAAAAKTRKWCNDYLQLQTDAAKPLYPPAAAMELLKALHAAAVSERWAGDTESALTLAWATLGLQTDLKLKTEAEQRAALGPIIPLRVRPLDFAKDGKPVPIESKLKDRLTQYAHFRPEEFIAAFNKLRE